MKDLVLLYGALTTLSLKAQDDSSPTSLVSLRISSEVRLQLRILLELLETVRAEVGTQNEDDKRYAAILVGLRTTVSHPTRGLVAGSAYIDRLLAEGSYETWWTCERKHPFHDRELVTPCDSGTRDELRTCGRVSYTSL